MGVMIGVFKRSLGVITGGVTAMGILKYQVAVIENLCTLRRRGEIVSFVESDVTDDQD